MNTTAAAKGPVNVRLGHRLRDLTDRIRNLENQRVVNVGKWRLEEDKHSGDLVAVHPRTGARCTLAALVKMED